MNVLLWIIGVLLAVIAGVVLLLVVVIVFPGRLNVSANTIGSRRVVADYGWNWAGFGLEIFPDEGDLFLYLVMYRGRFCVFSSTLEKRERKKAEAEEDDKIEVAARTFHDQIHDVLQKLERLITESMRRDITEDLVVGLFKGLGPIVVRFVKKLIRVSKFRKCWMQLAYGANDPAETGQFFGYGSIAMPFLNLSDRVKVELMPSFEKKGLFFSLEVMLTVYPYRLLGAFLVLLFRLLGLWRRERKKQGFGMLPRRT